VTVLVGLTAMVGCNPAKPKPGAGASPGASASASATDEPTPGTSGSATSSLGASKPGGPDPAPDPGGCPMLPADSGLRADVSRLPLHPRSSTFVNSIGAGKRAKADFGAGLLDDGRPFGIPITLVPPGTAGTKVTFDYDDESDKGPYPIPANPLIEGGPNGDGDRHILLLDQRACKAYELFDTHRKGSGWHAGSGAVFDLRSNRLRPSGWTSADAAGLPMIPLLVRYEEVAAGRIDHAIRITVPRSSGAFLWPARHQARTGGADDPPMGLRLRLKAGVNVSKFPPQARVVAEAMKKHGVIIADNGSSWFISGTQDSRWKNDQLRALGGLSGSDFEAVDVSSLMVDRNSGAGRR